MVAKGKDASDLFPAVVKNVVSKNTEVSFLNRILIKFWAVIDLQLTILCLAVAAHKTIQKCVICSIIM
jgi:vesicle coat complex subunit